MDPPSAKQFYQMNNIPENKNLKALFKRNYSNENFSPKENIFVFILEKKRSLYQYVSPLMQGGELYFNGRIY